MGNRPYFILLFLISMAVSLVINGIHSGISTPLHSHPYIFVGGSGIHLCKIQFAITGTPRSYIAILYAATGTSNTISTNILDYFHKNPRDYEILDLENAIKGQDQTVQIASLFASTNIFIQILVAESISFTYTITITELPDSSYVSGCTYPPAVQPAPSPFCSSCSGSMMSGVYCDFQDITLSNNSQITRTIPAGKYIAFTIPSSKGTITLNYAVDQPFGELFIQFKTFSGQVAGLVNMARVSNGYAGYLISSPSQITISSGGSDISIGVINQVSVSINFTIRYTVQQQSINILIVILGVLGGVLLVVLIIAACCIIKRMRNPAQIMRQDASFVASQIQIQSNMLTTQEIQMYFPSVTCSSVFIDPQSSSLTLNNNKQNQNIDKDCVICLCPVDVNELMKVTYCRHIFHSHCLVEWFKKQRNCPYCREEYSKSSTIQHYQNLLKNTHKNILIGGQLVKAILLSKMNKSAIWVEQIKE